MSSFPHRPLRHLRFRFVDGPRDAGSEFHCHVATGERTRDVHVLAPKGEA